ncbi:MAG TPA: hypothetical protein VGN64_00210 [Dyadobacter sp.]|jgi:hypothetical protein|nr:hypothetical protein [Dyadobacter sp.]
MKQTINIDLLENNTGQIKGLPENPRYITDAEFETLKQSVIDDAEMLYARELLVIPHGKKYVVFCGNMRLRGIQALIDMPADEYDKIVESKRGEPFFDTWHAAILQIRNDRVVPCKVFPKDTHPDKLRAISVRDNVNLGKWNWEMLANEWDVEELESFGLDIPDLDTGKDEPEEPKGISKKLTVECDTVNKLEDLFEELQNRGFVVTLK